ncbi:MAG: hypothetical protein GF331_00590 [Chitinivibrionales bacterium]|nr:hypothetical protein [Chitinivibrionales bacterium]
MLKVPFLRLFVVFVAAHLAAYLVAGMIVQPLYEPLFRGDSPLLACYLRTTADPALYKQAMAWAFPAQIARALLLALVLLPILDRLLAMRFVTRSVFLFGLFFVYMSFACSAPGANIEGLVYLKPAIVGKGFVPGLLESVLHALIASLIAARFLVARDRAVLDSAQ